jgi:hypothetical protein
MHWYWKCSGRYWIAKKNFSCFKNKEKKSDDHIRISEWECDKSSQYLSKYFETFFLFQRCLTFIENPKVFKYFFCFPFKASEQCDWPEQTTCHFDPSAPDIQKVEGPTFVYLTFDDGPNEGTEFVLVTFPIFKTLTSIKLQKAKSNLVCYWI